MYSRRAGGYTVVATTDPREALSLVDAQDWDILITDLNLPHLSGLDVIRAVRARRPGIGVIVISGTAGINDAVEALRLQADDFLVKPVVAALLLSRVADLVAAQSARRRREVVLGHRCPPRRHRDRGGRDTAQSPDARRHGRRADHVGR